MARLLDDVIFKFIDAKLISDGRIKTNDVCSVFGIGRQKVSATFTKYRKANPKNMKHDINEKCYVIKKGFLAANIKQEEAEEYLKAVRVVFGSDF